MALTDEQIERYSRHIILKEVGAKGQKKLLNAKVLIIGAGGLGAPAAMYLGAAGVGTIGIVDADEVDLSNLQRQIIHGLLLAVELGQMLDLKHVFLPPDCSLPQPDARPPAFLNGLRMGNDGQHGMRGGVP